MGKLSPQRLTFHHQIIRVASQLRPPHVTYRIPSRRRWRVIKAPGLGALILHWKWSTITKRRSLVILDDILQSVLKVWAQSEH